MILRDSEVNKVLSVLQKCRSLHKACRLQLSQGLEAHDDKMIDGAVHAYNESCWSVSVGFGAYRLTVRPDAKLRFVNDSYRLEVCYHKTGSSSITTIKSSIQGVLHWLYTIDKLVYDGKEVEPC